VWWNWQRQAPERRLFYAGHDHNGEKVTLLDMMYPWGINVWLVIDTNSPMLCYEYSNGIEVVEPANLQKRSVPPAPLRIPTPLPNRWIAMNKLNELMIRNTEKRLADIVEEVHWRKQLQGEKPSWFSSDQRKWKDAQEFRL
jgi:hypothetical protein